MRAVGANSELSDLLRVQHIEKLPGPFSISMMKLGRDKNNKIFFY
jgi:hypothetical protein